jgi:hypothetical protein
MVEVEEWVCTLIMTEKGSSSAFDLLMRIKSGFKEEEALQKIEKRWNY